MTDDDECAAIRRLKLNDIRDVVKEIAVASILLDKRLELLEAEMLALMRQADKPGDAAAIGLALAASAAQADISNPATKSHVHLGAASRISCARFLSLLLDEHEGALSSGV